MGGKVFWEFWRKPNLDPNPKRLWTYTLAGVVGLLGIVGISLLGNWETSWRRLNIAGFNLGSRSPVEIYRQMLPDAGVMGFGPGTFRSVFPAYQKAYDFGGRAFPSFWKEGLFQHAHQDYLETLIEWGWLGGVFFGVLVFGGVGLGLRRYFQNRTESHWLLFGSLLAVAGTLAHGLIDFPLQIASIQLYVCVLLGICWGSRSASPEQSKALLSRRTSRKASAALLTVKCLAFAAWCPATRNRSGLSAHSIKN